MSIEHVTLLDILYYEKTGKLMDNNKRKEATVLKYLKNRKQ